MYCIRSLPLVPGLLRPCSTVQRCAKYPPRSSSVLHWSLNHTKKVPPHHVALGFFSFLFNKFSLKGVNEKVVDYVCVWALMADISLSRFEILWLTLCQLHNEFTIEVSVCFLYFTHPWCQVSLRGPMWQPVDAHWLPLQFLPVYTPSEEEKRNPALFAINVRRVMAK